MQRFGALLCELDQALVPLGLHGKGLPAARSDERLETLVARGAPHSTLHVEDSGSVAAQVFDQVLGVKAAVTEHLALVEVGVATLIAFGVLGRLACGDYRGFKGRLGGGGCRGLSLGLVGGNLLLDGGDALLVLFALALAFGGVDFVLGLFGTELLVCLFAQLGLLGGVGPQEGTTVGGGGGGGQCGHRGLF